MTAPVVPANHDGIARRERLLNVLKGEDVVHILPSIDGGVALKALHAVKHGDHLAQAGRTGLEALRAQRREAFLRIVAAQAVPLQHHQCAGHAAAPLA